MTARRRLEERQEIDPPPEPIAQRVDVIERGGEAVADGRGITGRPTCCGAGEDLMEGRVRGHPFVDLVDSVDSVDS